MGTLEALVREEMKKQGLKSNEHLIGDAIIAVARKTHRKRPFKNDDPLSTTQAEKVRAALTKFLDR